MTLDTFVRFGLKPATPATVEPGVDDRDLVRRLQELAETQQQSSDRIGELAGRMATYREGAADSVTAAEAVQREAESGRRSMEALGQTASELTEMSASFGRTAEVLRQVAADLEVIEQIALETNILGINAAIESARASSHGRGFAVVASSMRELARQSRDVVDKISDSLKRVATEVEAVSAKAQHTVEQNEAHVRDAGERFQEIVRGACGVVDGAQAMAGQLDDERTQTVELSEELLRGAEQTSAAVAEAIGAMEGAIVDLDPKAALARLGDVHVIDVRNPDELVSELSYIEGCENLPLGDDLEPALRAKPKDAPTLFVCRKGGRSARAAQLARSLGFTDVYNLAGGMERWNEAGLPVARQRLERAS